MQLEVVAYDPSWPGRYAWWRDRLEGQLVDTVVRIERVGAPGWAHLGVPRRCAIVSSQTVGQVG